ncbi:hypothetical protein [Microtetraspora sp. NBRC 16547]|uniref:hypothetical protein n=1 Tax=Microtetraspora sp. NBRC 16547 TaxID=3030993 RepID=UPI0024A4A212|nr:hypothetical protein [Microtetraspora sp. NBRC 16547]GLX02778.1 hypothetical protein Misp02_68640 [Microtetraspora sp. NBRC 16547]
MNPRIAFVAAPLLVLAYGVIRILDGLDGVRGPGLAWTSGHLAFIAALALSVPVFWHMRRLAGRGTLSTVSTVIGFVGTLALFAQFVIDIVVSFMATDRDGMDAIFTQVQAVPGVSFAVYDGLPILFYVGQLALIVQLTVQRHVKIWVPFVYLLNIVMPLVDKDLIPVGAVFLLVSFIPLIGQVSRTAEPVPAAA